MGGVRLEVSIPSKQQCWTELQDGVQLVHKTEDPVLLLPGTEAFYHCNSKERSYVQAGGE